MPRYAKRKGRGGFRRKRKTFRRKRTRKLTGKKLLADARSARINSAAEKAIAIIAKRQAEKLISPNLLFRRTLWGTYDRETNVFGAGTPVDMAGLMVHACQIPIWDIQTMTTVAPSVDPALVPTIPLYPRGANVLAAGVDQNGYRTNSDIHLKNLGCQLRFFLPALRLATGVINTPRHQDTTVHYSLVAMSSPDAYILGWKPDIGEIMPFKGIGYSSRLDDEVTDDSNDGRRRVLARGSVKMRYSEIYAQERFTKLYWSGSLPYEFKSYSVAAGTAADQNGQQVVGKYKVFLCLRCDTPAGSPVFEKPTVQGFVKCGYRNIT